MKDKLLKVEVKLKEQSSFTDGNKKRTKKYNITVHGKLKLNATMISNDGDKWTFDNCESSRSFLLHDRYLDIRKVNRKANLIFKVMAKACRMYKNRWRK